MTTPWTAEAEVAPALARVLITEQFPQFAHASLEDFGSGWDNTAYLIDGRWVFRFPRRQKSVPLLIQECLCLPALAPLLPVPVPVPKLIGVPANGYPFPFAAYPLLPGITACRAQLDAAQRFALAEPLADVLRTLHQLPIAALGDIQVVPDQLQRLAVATRTPQALLQIEGMEVRGDATSAQAEELARILSEAAAAGPPRADCLVHGDCYVRHLLVDGQGALTGVIDWGDLHRGDPAMDLMIAVLVLTPQARARFRAVYGRIDQHTARLARFRAVVHLGNLLAFAHATNDTLLVAELRIELGHLLVPPEQGPL